MPSGRPNCLCDTRNEVRAPERARIGGPYLTPRRMQRVAEQVLASALRRGRSQIEESDVLDALDQGRRDHVALSVAVRRLGSAEARSARRPKGAIRADGKARDVENCHTGDRP